MDKDFVPLPYIALLCFFGTLRHLLKESIITKILSVFFLLVGCASADTETLEYKVLKKEGKIEIREYEPYIAASVTFDNKEDFEDKAFRVLAGYIFGKNIRQENIGMTSPVMNEGEDIGMTAPVITEGEDIGMTSPVFNDQRKEGWTMTFTMPARYTMETLPMPVDDRVVITEVPRKTVAAIRFSGFRTDRKNARKEKELREWLVKENIEVSGPASFAGYNPPWTLPMLRRNEVMIEVKF